ncbi:hypothetical protein B0H16DRAFT_1635482 [Mycena metata]|uniref:Uncharacterized protein n=1 Tax=Mycena metata TaxID=1033252 RepID=A0AAD7GV29_9AGAR|nr:hypothetical protein B0H16DRAFT_1635482 [Mycena metata]
MQCGLRTTPQYCIIDTSLSAVQGSDCGPIDDSCRCAHCRRKKTSCSFKEDYILYLDGSGPQPLLEPRFGAIPTPQPETAAFAQPGAQLSVVPPPAYPPTAPSPVYPSTAPPPVYPSTTPPPVYPPTAPAFAQHTEAVLPGSSRMVEGPVAASDQGDVEYDAGRLGTGSDPDNGWLGGWGLPPDHPAITMLRIQKEEIARLQREPTHTSGQFRSESGIVVNAAHRTQYLAMEILYEFQATPLNRQMSLEADSFGVAELVERLQHVYFQFLADIDTSLLPSS